MGCDSGGDDTTKLKYLVQDPEIETFQRRRMGGTKYMGRVMLVILCERDIRLKKRR